MVMMNIDSVRSYCLSLPGATEGIQWENDLLFRIAGKIFAVVALEQSPNSVSFKCTPEEFAGLIEREGIIPAPYMARNKWVAVQGFNVLGKSETERLIRNSYDMVLAKLPKKVQAEFARHPSKTRATSKSR
jgi:predicted DNA-binding protein (MmcQ/YjbR family)